MNKHLLLRKISSIHAAKCNQSENFKEAVASFEKLDELKKIVINADNSYAEEIIQQIQAWAESAPAVANL